MPTDHDVIFTVLVAIASLAREMRWIEAALMTGALGFIGFLSVRPLKQMVHRSTTTDPAR
jgi:hypothetical protein